MVVPSVLAEWKERKRFSIKVVVGGKSGMEAAPGLGKDLSAKLRAVLELLKALSTHWSHAQGCALGVPVLLSTDCAREDVVPSSQLQIWHFKLLPKCNLKVFSTLQKFLKSKESRKHHAWDAALGNLRRGCRFSKDSCGAAGRDFYVEHSPVLLIWRAEISMWNTPQSLNFPMFDPPSGR